MMSKKIDKRWRAVWLVVGLALGCFVPYTCERCERYVAYLIGSNCWKALIQLEQLKSQSLTTPAAEKDRV